MLENTKTKKIYWLLLVAIVLAALFLRLHNIDIVPAGIYPDEAVNGTDAILANETGDYRWFFTNNYGREGLFINLIALAVKIFGNTALGLKFWSIIFGTLTVLGTFLLTKELFRGSWRAGLIASYMTAFSFWSINFSRIAFRAIMLPAVLVFSFYFFFRGIRTRNYFNFIVSGLIFGIGIHTYIAFRISPLILIVLLIALILSKENFLKNYWKHGLVFMVAVIISAAPILVNFMTHPEYFQSRSSSISVFSPEVNKGHPIQTLARSVGLSLVKFNFWGDQNWRHNYPPYPVLNPVIGISFLAGIIYLLVKFFHLLSLRLRHKIKDEKLYIYTFLLSWFAIMLTPEFLTEEGLPHALRSIGTLPVVYIIATLPILWLLSKTRDFRRPTKNFILPFIILAFAFVGIFNTFKYHTFWANHPEQHGAFNEDYRNISNYINSLPGELNKYVVANGEGRIMEDGLPVSAQTIKFLTYGKAENMEFLTNGDDTILEKPMTIILMKHDRYIIDQIKMSYPDVEQQNISLTPEYGGDFIIFNIK